MPLYAADTSGADVLLSHDCPSGVVHSFPPADPRWDPADLARAGVHAERLQRIVDAVRPGVIVHGHLHMGYQRVTDLGYGPVEVTGLDRDGARYNYLVLDTGPMRWSLPGDVD